MDLRRIIEAAQIESAETVIFDGQRFTIADGDEAESCRPASQPLVTRLQELLYTRCYCRTFFPGQVSPSLCGLDRALAQRLTEAASRPVGDDRDGTLTQTLSSGLFVVQSRSRRRRDTKENAPPPALIRIYFNQQALGVVTLAALLCQGLNEAQIPFVFKCQGHPAGYDRRDAGVLYLQAGCYLDTIIVLKTLYTRLSRTLAPDVPLFTKRLANGIGLAEEPMSRMSFGRHRCWLFAEGLWNAYLDDVVDTAGRLRRVKRSFAAHGIRMETPYLNPGSVDRYPVLEDV